MRSQHLIIFLYGIDMKLSYSSCHIFEESVELIESGLEIRRIISARNDSITMADQPKEGKC